jgi:hypothetical protein
MRADKLVKRLGEKMIGMWVETPAMGKYPGGLAVVYALSLDDNCPAIVMNVVLPEWGVCGVFEEEEVTAIHVKLIEKNGLICCKSKVSRKKR